MINSQLIEKFKKYSTPFYYYDIGLLEKNLSVLKEISLSSKFKIHYALKANADKRLLNVIRRYGFGADCVSGNEIKRALETGFPKEKIVFAGVGKTDKEILLALENDIHCFNCESIQELEVINGFAKKTGKIATIALRINPNLDANTHHYITTGLGENKFGINTSELNDALSYSKNLKHLSLIGLHFHIGSQITDLNVFKKLCIKVNEIQEWFRERNVKLSHLNVGGGLGVDYHHPDENPIPNYQSYFQVFKSSLNTLPEQTLYFELGRAVVANCGALISRVLYVKKGINIQFAVLDAGMTELIRPALYHSYHKIENLTGTGNPQKYDVVGPVCESSDFFGKGVTLPETKRGDLVAIRTVGAYAEVMASRYNLRDPAKVIYSNTI